MKKLISTSLLFTFLLFCFISCSDDPEEPDEMDPQEQEQEEEENNDEVLSSLKIGLLAHLAFEGNADDISNEAYTGSVVGASITSDRKGNPTGAYYFDGKDDYINYGNLTKLGLGSFAEYTITSWVKPERSDENIRTIIISKWNGGVFAGWYLGVNPDSTAITYRNVVPWATYGIEPIIWGEYVHLACTYDGQNLTLYVNGEVDNSVPFSSHPNDVYTDVLVGASHSQNNIVPSFKGNIDGIRIYNRVLDREEMKYLAEH